MRRTGSRGYSAVSATITSDPEPTEVMPTPSPVIIPTSIVKIGRTTISRGAPSDSSRCIDARRRASAYAFAPIAAAATSRTTPVATATASCRELPCPNSRARNTPLNAAGTEPAHIKPAIRRSAVRFRMWTNAPNGLVTAETTRSLPTAASGGMPKKNISIGVIRAPPPMPVSPTTTATANDAPVRAGLGSVMEVPSLCGQPASGGEQLQDHSHGILAAQLRCVDHEVGVVWCLVWVRYPGEPGDCTCPRLRVQPLTVPGLARFERCRHVHEQEITSVPDHLAHPCARCRIWRDRRADRNAAVSRRLGRDEADPCDVEITVCAGETQPSGKQPPDQVTIKQGNRSVAPFGKSIGEVAGDGGLA